MMWSSVGRKADFQSDEVRGREILSRIVIDRTYHHGRRRTIGAVVEWY